MIKEAINQRGRERERESSSSLLFSAGLLLLDAGREEKSTRDIPTATRHNCALVVTMKREKLAYGSWLCLSSPFHQQQQQDKDAYSRPLRSVPFQPGWPAAILPLYKGMKMKNGQPSFDADDAFVYAKQIARPLLNSGPRTAINTHQKRSSVAETSRPRLQ